MPVISNTNMQRLLRMIPNFAWPFKILILKTIVKSGKNFKLGPNVTLYNYKGITIGDNVFIGDGTTIGGNVSVTIGNNVMFGPEVMIRGGDHNISQVGKPMAEVKTGGVNLPVTIENDVWIGTRAIVLKGVTLMEGCVIGAGSVVTKSQPPYSICFGNPCKPVRLRFSESDLERHLSEVKSGYTKQLVIELFNKTKKPN